MNLRNWSFMHGRIVAIPRKVVPESWEDGLDEALATVLSDLPNSSDVNFNYEGYYGHEESIDPRAGSCMNIDFLQIVVDAVADSLPDR